MAKPEIKILNTSRGPVEYLDTGKGEVILSLHGAMGGYDQAFTLARTIGPSNYRYLSLSRPGYLGTPLRTGKTPEEQADLYAEVIGLLGISQVIVFAISGGGPSAVHFALRHPDKCRGLVLVSTLAGPAKNKIPVLFQLMLFMAKLPFVVSWLKKKTEANLKRRLKVAVSDPATLEKMLSNPDVVSLYKEVAVGSFDRITERIPGTKNDIEISKTGTYPLKDIAVPTLVIHGTKDPLVSFEEHGLRLSKEIPGAQLLAVEGGGHISIFTHREEVRSKVSAFLEGFTTLVTRRDGIQAITVDYGDGLDLSKGTTFDVDAFPSWILQNIKEGIPVYIRAKGLSDNVLTFKITFEANRLRLTQVSKDDVRKSK